MPLSGPQPHPSFIEVFSAASVHDRHRTVAGAYSNGGSPSESRVSDPKSALAS